LDKNRADINHLKYDNKIRTSLNSLVVRPGWNKPITAVFSDETTLSLGRCPAE